MLLRRIGATGIVRIVCGRATLKAVTGNNSINKNNNYIDNYKINDNSHNVDDININYYYLRKKNAPPIMRARFSQAEC